ncbi:MAG: hypothetical protein GC134_04390 [Proteobacteria bacterium]|nr:hypothetical protein [Pseudomonadota bacterium]
MAGGLTNLPPEALLARWRWLDAPYTAGRACGSGDRSVHTCKRSGKLALASVHGIAHYSGPAEDDYKKPDAYTGGLTELVAELVPCSVVANRLRVPDINPHAGEAEAERVLKDWQQQGVCHILDIHGAKADCGFDIAIGTGGGVTSAQQPMIELVEKCARVHGLDCALNPPNYAALGSVTLTRRMLDANFDGILQLEICRTSRHPFNGDRRAATLVAFLTQLATLLNTESL